MKKTYRIYALLFALLFGTFNYAQQENRNKGIFVKQQNEFFGEIMKGIKEFEKTPEKEKKVFKMDLTGMDLPKSVNEFKSYWTQIVSILYLVRINTCHEYFIFI